MVASLYLFSSQQSNGLIYCSVYVLQKQAAVSGLRSTCFLTFRIHRGLLKDDAIKDTHRHIIGC